MYNYYTSQKKKHHSEKVEIQKVFNQRSNDIKLKKDSKLIRRFIQRSTHGYQRMFQAHKELKQFKQYHHQFRKIDRSKNIGPPDFYYKARDDKSRVNQATKQNQNLDEVPFYLDKNPSIHNFRQTKSKQNFKYTSYDTVSRVIQQVQKMKTNQVPTSWQFNIRTYLKQKSGNKQTKNHSRSISTTSDRKLKQIILPSLNMKYYPKSLQSLKNGIEVGPLKDAIINEKNHTKLKQLKVINKKDRDIKFSTVHCHEIILNNQQKQQ